MATVDIVIIAIIVLSALFGILRGLVKEALSLFFWIAAGVLAGTFDDQLAGQLTGVIAAAPVRQVAGFAIIFIATVFTGGLLTNLISKMTSAVGLGGTDRALGALFGLIRGVIIVTLIVMMTAQFQFTRQWYDQSLSVPYILRLAEYLSNLLGMDPGTLMPDTSAYNQLVPQE